MAVYSKPVNRAFIIAEGKEKEFFAQKTDHAALKKRFESVPLIKFTSPTMHADETKRNDYRK